MNLATKKVTRNKVTEHSVFFVLYIIILGISGAEVHYDKFSYCGLTIYNYFSLYEYLYLFVYKHDIGCNKYLIPPNW